MTVYWRVNRETLQTLVYLWVTSPECTSRARISYSERFSKHGGRHSGMESNFIP